MSVALHHEIRGQPGAPAVLLGHSLGTNMRMWDAVAPVLAESFRVVAFDHRGQGRSPVPPAPYEIADLGGDVLALMDDLGIERAHYCGLSIGAMTGMWLGAHAPQRVDRLVLLCTCAHFAAASRWVKRAAEVRAAGSTEPIADRIAGRWLTPGFAAAHPDVRDRVRAMLVASPAEGYAACCGAIERMDLRADLTRIAAPTLVVAGDDDPATPPEHLELIAEAISGAGLELVAGAAHLATAEQPAAVTRLVLEHLAG